MARNYKKQQDGFTIVPKTTTTSDSQGEMEVLDSDGKLRFHNGVSNSPVVTETHAATLTNKTLTSPVINTGVSGTAIDTDGTLAANSDTLLASQKAVKTYVDTSSGAVQDDVDDLITLSGVPANSTDLGTFTGTTIPDGSDNKEAFQALETALEAHIADPTDAHDASAISNVPAGTIASTDVQSAINELDGDIQGHITDAVDAHDASAISNVPAGTIAATDVQAAINELDTDIQGHITDAVDAHDASAISVVPTGNLVSTDVQSALVEHQEEIDDLVTLSGVASGSTDLGTFTGTTIPDGSDIKEALQSLETAVETNAAGDVEGPGSATDEALARFDGTTGKLIQNSVVTLSDTGTMSGITQLNVDNLRLDGNTVSSTDTNGNIELTPNGTGDVNLNKDTRFFQDVAYEITADNASGANATLSDPATKIIRLTNAALTSIDMIPAGSEGQQITLINATGAIVTVNDDTGGTAANRILTGQGASIQLNDEASLILEYDNVESRWMVIGGTGSGSGSSGINYIDNPDAEAGTTGWATYADAAATTPVDGTGGSPNITLAASSSNPLRGTQSFLLTKDAANRQGQGVSYDFTIDRADLAQVLRISFNYETSTNYADTISGNTITSDMQVFVYDVTNAQLIYVTDQNIRATNLEGNYIGSFQASSNSQSYRLIFHIASTNANSYTLKFDNVAVGPQSLTKGQAISTQFSRISQTASFGNADITGALTSSEGSGIYSYNSGTGIYTVILSAYFNITATFRANGAASVQPLITDSAGANEYGTDTSIATAAARTVASASIYLTAGSTFKIRNALAGTTNEQYINVTATRVLNNVTLSEDTGNRVIAARAGLTGDQAIASTSSTKVTFNTVSSDARYFDTTSSFNTSSNRFVAPESRYYRITTQLTIANYTSSEQLGLEIIKGGATVLASKTETNALANFSTSPLTTIAFLSKDEYVEVFVDSLSDASYTVAASASGTFFIVEAVATPQTLAGSETVAASYTTNTAQAVTNGNTVIYEDLDFDTHGAYNTSTGVYTFPVSGKYQVSAGVITASVVAALGNTLELSINNVTTSKTIRGAGDVCENTASRTYSATANGLINATKGQTLTITFSESLPAVNLGTNAAYNYFTIAKVG